MFARRFILLTLILLIQASELCHAQTSYSKEKVQTVINEFTGKLERDIQADSLGGSISGAIIIGNEIVWASAIGYADKEKKIKADTSTIYRLGSLSKAFTSVLMMKLVEEGKIKLDDPVEQYLPEVKRLNGYSGSTRITFRQLASHTSGLQREPQLLTASTGEIEKWEKKVLQCIPETSFENKPSQKFLYSNIGYAILGLALSRVAGRSFDKLINEKIFQPLHMRGSFYMVPKSYKMKLAAGMDNSKRGEVNLVLPKTEHRGRGYRVPNGGLYSRPQELAKFIISLMHSGPPLKPESWLQMQTIQPPASKYGFGLEIESIDGINLVMHSGYVSGYVAEFAIDKGNDCAVILMRNYNVGRTHLERSAVHLLSELRKAMK